MTAKRVLIIDDEADVRAVVRGCLEDLASWQVTTAASAKEGLVKVLAEQPDAILLDVMMPGMDGLSFLRALRTYLAGEARSTPVVLLTAKASFSPADELPQLAVKGVISKPFEPLTLANQIANFLGWQPDAAKNADQSM